MVNKHLSMQRTRVVESATLVPNGPESRTVMNLCGVLIQCEQRTLQYEATVSVIMLIILSVL